MTTDPKKSVLKNSPAFGFGTSKRRNTSKPMSEKSPGPGEYDLREKIFSISSAKSIGLKLKSLSMTCLDGPGPAAYSPNA